MTRVYSPLLGEHADDRLALLERGDRLKFLAQQLF